MRSVDAKNPAGLGPPAFDRVEDAAAEVHAMGERCCVEITRHPALLYPR